MISLDFPTDEYLEDHLQGILDHPLYPLQNGNPLELKNCNETSLTLLHYLKKGPTKLLLVYEAFSSTIADLVQKRIAKNENFSVAELWKLLKRMVRINLILEEAGESCSGLGYSRIGILDNGEIRVVWFLGGMSGPGGDAG